MLNKFARLIRNIRSRQFQHDYRSKNACRAFELLESRCMLIGSAWSNGLSPLNVDNDEAGSISPLDVLAVINELNGKVIADPQTGRLPVPIGSGAFPPPYLDVDCDQFVSPLDALVIINHLNGAVTPVGQAFTRSNGASGNFSTLGCGPALREGSSFVTSLTTQLTIPPDAAALSFVLEGIEFDSTIQGAIHDAFEVALLDLSGRSLVHPIAIGRDAFFNSSEGLAPLGTPQVAISGNRVTLSLANVFPGTQANLEFRLVNNDTDTETAVAIRSVEFVGAFSVGQVSPERNEKLAPRSIDFSLLSNVSASFVGEYGSTSYNEESDELVIDLAIRNSGQYLVQAPLLVGITNISDPKVRVRGFDGVTPDGIPYYDYPLAATGTLLPKTSSSSKSVSFYVPNGRQFSYDLVFFAQLNQSPQFTSVPVVEALPGVPYQYDVDAVDPDGDSIAFSLLSAPNGMAVDANTGMINWDPTIADQGTHTVIVRVDDGKGGSTQQSYVTSVIEPPPNRPPLFTSLPVVGAAAANPYLYRSASFDPDGDALSFALATSTVAIPIVNHSFEAQVLAEDAFTIGILTGWTLTGGAFAGAANPGLSQYPGGEVPDGQNMAYSNDPAISQVLSEPVRPNTHYVLTVAVGDRLDNTLNASFIQLRAGGQALASSSAPLPPNGTFRDVSIIFDSPNEHPMLGQLLEIRLAGSTGINWDNVRLTATEIFTPPNGMTIDAATGVVAWTPTVDQIGTHDIRVQASDGRGGTAIQAYKIRVAPDPANRSPIIISEPTPSVLVSPVPGNRSRQTLDFEGLPSTTSFLQGSNVPPEARLFDRFLATHGVTLRSGNGVLSVAVIGLGVGHATSGSNGIGGMGSATTIEYEVPVVAEFFVAGDPSIPALTDFVSVKVDRQGASGTIVLQGFGLDGVLLESTSAIDNGFAVLTLSTPGIHKAVIRGTSSTSYDDFSFNQVYPAQIYQYKVRSIDPDDDALTYSLTTAPFGMSIDSSNGTIRWPVASLNVGTPLVTVRVDDRRNGFDSQNFVVAPTTTPAKISGTVYNDQNGDGVRDEGEAGLGGRTLYLDESRNYRRDSGEHFAITDINGNYVFNNLAPGGYTVREEPQLGSRLTNPAGGAFEINLVDSQVLTGQDFGNIESTVPNMAPEFTTAPPVSGSVGVNFRYDAAASDADLDPLLFDMLVGPDGMAVDPRTGIVVWTPATDQVRTHDVVLRVSDGRGGVDLQSFTVGVAAAQTAPVVITPPPQATSVVNQSYEYRFHAQDAENDPLVFSLDQSAAGMAIDAVSGLFTWSPEVGQLGAHTVTVKVSDGRGGQDTLTFPLQVVASTPNFPPVITSTPRTRTHLGGMYLYAVEALDANNDHVELTLVKAPDGMVLDRNTGLIRWVPSPEQLNDNEVEIHADDGHGGSADLSFVIRVAPTVFNESPQIVSSPNLTGTIESPYKYNPRALDSDSDPLVWNLNKAPRGMSIDARLGTIHWIPDVDQIGLADVSVLVTDAQGGRAAQSFTITIRAINVSPAISTVPPPQGSVGQIYNYAVRASDADGDTLSYTVAMAPVGMTIDTATGLIQWTPNVTQVGSHSVIVLVQDGRGGTATQIYTVNVVAAPINHPPTITTSPVFVAAVGLAYSYDANAKDVDGDSLTFQLLAAPAGMSINAISGVIIWTPVASQFGTHRVVLAVSDRASIAAQSFVVRVESNNRSPTIHSTPEQFITPGQVFRYDVNATDPDGNTLTYRLLSAPLGMAIDTLGRVTWNTSIADIGTHSISIQATDPFDASASQSFDLIVSADVEAPRASVEVSRSPAELGSDVTFLVSATDNVGVKSLVLIVDGKPLPVDANGRAVFLATVVGKFDVLVTATDAAGNTVMVSTSLEVIDTSDANAPEVAILSPSDEAVITQSVDVIGTANDENLLFYTLEVALLGSTGFTEIARGNTALAAGVLGTLDPTILQNDTYILRLTAVDTSGKSTSVEQTIHIEGNLKLGNFSLSFTDLTVPVFGVPITVSRTYDTLTAGQSGDFGFGWRLEFRNMNLRTSVARNELDQYGVFNPFKVGSRVYVTLPGGVRQGFTFRPQVSPGFRGSFLGIFEPRFVPDPGVRSSLTVSPSDLRLNRFGEAFDYGTGLAYNPASGLFGRSYLLTTKDGTAFDIDGQTGQLKSLSNGGDDTLSFSDTGIVGPEGKSISFERDPQGRIVAVVDPAGQRIRYRYDARGDLVAVTDRTNNTTQFVFRSQPAHYLDRVIDPLGRVGVRTDYDEEGRLSEVIDAAGKPIRFAYDPRQLVSNIVDALGNTTTEVYDDRGNIVRRIDALGGVTLGTYDNDNNKLTETDPLGRTTKFTYDDRADVLTRTDPLGNTTISTYQAFTFGTTALAASRGEASAPFTRLGTTTDPLGNTTAYEYNSAGNLTDIRDQTEHSTIIGYDKTYRPPISTTDASGNVTQFETNNGLLVRQVDALGHVASFTYDANGNQLTSTTTITSADGTVGRLTTANEYDAQGRVIAFTDAVGSRTRTEYDAVGNRVATIDALGRRTEYRYDERNQLVETVFPDATLLNAFDNPRTKSEYDALGRETARIDELGRRTEFHYDALGRRVKTTHADGSFSLAEYDLAGQVIALVDQLGRRTEFRYDVNGRQTVSLDALGNSQISTYDAAGRRTAQTDALLHTTAFFYDAAGHLTEAKFADGTTTRTSFDRRGLAIAYTDQLNQTSRYEYDALDRNTAIVDPLGNRTTFTHDENSNLLTSTATRTGADGAMHVQVTRTDYDELGRAISMHDALGGVTRSEWDTVGNRTATIDALGRRTEYRFDERNRLIETIYPDRTSTDLSDNPRSKIEYDASGQVTARIDELGLRTLYQYDVLGGLTKTIYADNTFTQSVYDAAGQVTARVDERGNRTEFEYDANGRRTVVRDPLDNSQIATYDVVGQRVAQIDALGHTTNFVYDPIGRLIRTEYADGSRIASSFDAKGQEIARIDQLGRTTRYEYDVVGRLTTLLDPINQRTEYGYDELGNLVLQKDAGGRVNRYEYDALARRTANVLALGQRSETTYDAIGNVTATKDFNGTTIAFAYDARDRLSSKRFPNGNSVDYAYTLSGQLTTETDSRGMTSYAYGQRNRLLARTEPDGSRVNYSYDPAGNRISITAIVAASSRTTSYTFDKLNRLESVTDPELGVTRYTYDASGNLRRTELPNGTAETRSYDDLNRLLFLENRGPSGVIASYRYSLSPTGHRTSIVEQDGRLSNFNYDALDRLTRETITDVLHGDRSFEYSYDAVGNRLTRNDSASGLTQYSYDANDRLLTEELAGAITQYTYDNNGNMLSRLRATDRAFYEWDFENRMVSSDTNGDDAIDVRNVYDSDGNRVSQTTGAQETRFLIDTVRPFAQVLLEYRPSGLVTASYVYGGRLVSQARDGARSFYHFDGLGSVRGLTDTNGVVLNRYVFDAFGTTLSQTGTTLNSYLFAGQQRDSALGLDYLRARYYDPALGRFTAADPLRGSIREPIYAYAKNDPVNRVDPSGMWSTVETTVAFAVLNGLFTGTSAYFREGRSFSAGVAGFFKGLVEGLLFGGAVFRAGKLAFALGGRAAQISFGVTVTAVPTTIGGYSATKNLLNAQTSDERISAGTDLLSTIAFGWFGYRGVSGTAKGSGGRTPVEIEVTENVASITGQNVTRTNSGHLIGPDARSGFTIEVIDATTMTQREVIAGIRNSKADAISVVDRAIGGSDYAVAAGYSMAGGARGRPVMSFFFEGNGFKVYTNADFFAPKPPRPPRPPRPSRPETPPADSPMGDANPFADTGVNPFGDTGVPGQ